MDSGDQNVLGAKTPGSSQQSGTSSSSSSFAVSSPQKNGPKGPAHMTSNEWENYKRRAFEYLTKSPLTGEEREKRVSEKTVKNQFRSVAVMNVLYWYEKTLNVPSMKIIN